jgi:hypothetical protein
MRFSARLACSLELLDVDDVLMQDELLDTFDLGEFSGNVDPKALADAMRRDRFRALQPLPPVPAPRHRPPEDDGRGGRRVDGQHFRMVRRPCPR